MLKSLDSNIRYSNVSHVTYEPTSIKTFNWFVSNLIGSIQRLYELFLYPLVVNNVITYVSHVTYDTLHYRILYGD